MPWTRQQCVDLDAGDPLAHVRDRFSLPADVIYLDGNSLGAVPKTVAPRIAKAIEHEWARGLIRSWNDAGWYRAPQRVGAKIAKLIGAADDEVIVTDSTSVDLFKVLTAALRMRPGRTKILGVVGDFPTDSYIANGVATFTGARFVRAAAETLANEIDEDVAVVVLTHVNYRSGLVHDMRALNAAAHAKGALIAWDLSHSAGVMPVGIGAAGADFAVGCGYKYLNGGPGAPAYVFVAKRHQQTFAHPLTGWLGHADPFAFASDFEPAQGMAKLLTGTPPVLSLLALDAALDAFDGVDMAQAYAKVQSLTGLFRCLRRGCAHRRRNDDARLGYGRLQSAQGRDLALLRRHHVVHIRVRREQPLPRQRIEHHAALGRDVEPRARQRRIELQRLHELRPIMRAPRQPTEHVLGADDREREGLGGPVDRGDEHQPGGLQHRGAAREEQIQVRDMLDHFHVEDGVEPLAGSGERLGRRRAIVDGKPLLLRMDARGIDVLRRRVGAQHLEPESRHRLAEQTPAAADVEQPEAGERLHALGIAPEMRRGLIADKPQPDRVELVQNPEFAVRIPPFGRQRRKARDFGLVDCGLSWCDGRHRVEPLRVA